MRIHNLFATLVISGSALASLTGCGALGAITNPDGVWALGEATPMSVIVRRAEVANATADQVDRLIADAPIDEASAEALKLTQADAKSLLEQAGTEPVYEVQQPVRVVPAEAWLKRFSAACAEDASSPSLISMLGDDVADKYTSVSSQGRKIAALKGKKKAWEKKADADGVSDADVAKYEKQVAKIETQIDELDAAFEPKVEKLLAAVKASAAKVSKDDKATMSPIVLNLKEAVDDARNANTAALMRYPLAMPSMSDDVQAAAKRFAADVIEEQTGTRPTLNGLTPDITLDGTDVKLTLNGIPEDKLGDIELDELVSETTVRTQDYVGSVLSLTGYVSESEDRLSFQGDLLEAWSEGLAVTTELTDGAIDITDLEVATKPGAKPAGDAEVEGKRTAGGLLLAKCGRPGADDAEDGEEADLDEEDGDEKAKADAKKPSGAKTRK